LDPKQGIHLDLKLTRVLPAIPVPADTKYVKRVSFKSGLISKFWARTCASAPLMVLPKGYDEHPDVHYPVVFHQGHSMEGSLCFVEQLPPAPPADRTPEPRSTTRRSRR